MSATQPLVVRPGPPLAGSIRPPGDEAVTHRALLLGALAEGTTVIEGANPGRACLATRRCAEALGAGITGAAGTTEVRGMAGRLAAPAAPLDCGDSAGTLHLLAGVLAGQPFEAVLTGDISLIARPLERVVEPLRRMGAALSARAADRLPPLTVRGGALRGMVFTHPTPSTLVSSAILLAGAQAGGATALSTAAGVRDHAAPLLRAFGATVEQRERACGPLELRLSGPVALRACRLQVPGDFPTAACFLAAGAASPGARVQVRRVGLGAAPLRFLEVLGDMGATVEVAGVGRSGDEAVGDVTVTGPPRLAASYIPADRAAALLDDIPAWMVAASAAQGVSRLRGLGALGAHEDARMSALVDSLGALGIRAERTSGGLDIEGGAVAGGRVDAGGDHRLAMALAVLGTRAGGPVRLEDGACLAAAYPGFAADARSWGGSVEEPAGGEGAA